MTPVASVNMVHMEVTTPWWLKAEGSLVCFLALEMPSSWFGEKLKVRTSVAIILIFFTTMQLRVVKFNMRNVVFKLYHPTFTITVVIASSFRSGIIIFSSSKSSKYIHLS